MGTTSDKLTYLNTTKSNLKDMINYGLDNNNKIDSNTTFRNYISSTFKAFIESLNNPNTLWGNLPKITGEGKEITLNNTIEAPMKLELNPSELEQGADPSPSNPQQIHTISGDNEIVVSNKNLFDGLFKLSAINYGVDYTNTDIGRTLNYSDLTGKYYTFGGYFKAGTYTFSIQKENDYYTMNRIAIAGTLCVQAGNHIRNSYTWTQAVDGYTYFALERDDGEQSYTDINFDGTNFML